MNFPLKILFFLPSTNGGIAEHAFCQVNALKNTGVNIVCLVSPGFLDGRKTDFEKVVCLDDPVLRNNSRVVRKIKMAWRLITNRFVLARQIIKHRPDLVLLDSYVEYLAPLWVWPHWLLSRLARVKYAANLHDPVRNFQLGPAWWHQISVRLAYLPLDFVLVHDNLPEPSLVPARVRVVRVPHGLYEIPGPVRDPATVRCEWGVRDGQKVFLAFGFVRDDKNLDLVVRALASVPNAFLVVAGSVASVKQKPFAFYHQLAADLGVSDRCRFFEGFVPDADLGKYFSGTDFVLLTYASSFHSQSGVLNIAARARKPVLTSGSPSPLLESVRNFNLGVTVEADSLEAITEGLRRLMNLPLRPRWRDYEATATWEANARGILQAVALDGLNLRQSRCVNETGANIKLS